MTYLFKTKKKIIKQIICELSKKEAYPCRTKVKKKDKVIKEIKQLMNNKIIVQIKKRKDKNR